MRYLDYKVTVRVDGCVEVYPLNYVGSWIKLDKKVTAVAHDQGYKCLGSVAPGCHSYLFKKED